jgi:CRISPR-associated protein Cas1
MYNLTPTDMKSVLHSKRANIYYLEYCRVLVKGGRVEYVTDEGRRSLYWNIPIANTTVLLLGNGTSITQAAMRELAKAGVLVGFSGGGGTPLYSGTQVDVEVAWLTPQSEYRPTQYLQSWAGFWFDTKRRLEAATMMQITRLNFIGHHWLSNRTLIDQGFLIDPTELIPILDASAAIIKKTPDVTCLLTEEGRLTKQLYRMAVQAVGYGDFTRAKRGGGSDPANRFLDHGNYLAYGLGASATWVLGIPHALSVLHGKTRRGGLVFDTADLIKDALILPQAFISAMNGDTEQDFRQACIESLVHNEALDFMIDTLKEVALKSGDQTG